MKIAKFTLTILITVLFIIACGDNEKRSTHEHEHGEESAAPEQPKGPHGGKYFEKNGFGLEVTIYEPGIPPQSRVYVYEDDKQIDPSNVQLVTELHRIDRVDTIHYKKQGDYLQGDIVVEEPHSFDVKLKAQYQGKDFQFEYSSYEGRTTLSDEAIKSTGIEIEKVGGATISTTVTLNGRISPNKLQVSALTARFPGVVKDIRKLPGSKVEKGEVIATIEANESLRAYELMAPRAGEVLDLTASVGEVVSDSEPIITVGDLSSVWVELSLPKSDFSKLKLGQKVLISKDDESPPFEGRIIYLSSLADGDTQTRLARAEVANLDRSLIPELFVEAKVVIGERLVPVAIKAEALQKFRDWDVVFKRNKEKFEIAILELGEQDGDWIEIKEGLKLGTEYVTKNSFVVKADVMKSGATHDH